MAITPCYLITRETHMSRFRSKIKITLLFWLKKQLAGILYANYLAILFFTLGGMKRNLCIQREGEGEGERERDRFARSKNHRW